jgi:hypothetical protein
MFKCVRCAVKPLALLTYRLSETRGGLSRGWSMTGYLSYHMLRTRLNTCTMVAYEFGVRCPLVQMVSQFHQRSRSSYSSHNLDWCISRTMVYRPFSCAASVLKSHAIPHHTGERALETYHSIVYRQTANLALTFHIARICIECRVHGQDGNIVRDTGPNSKSL